MRYPGSTWVPSPNFGTRRGRQPVAIVEHIMCGPLASCDRWFGETQSQVSAHFGIGKDGAVHQYVDTDAEAWANGAPLKPDLSLPWLALAVKTGLNPNWITLSIEHEGQPGDPWTPEMLGADIALARWLSSQYSIPPDRHHIIGHYQIDSVDRANCPGPSFPWDALMGALAPASPSPVPQWAQDAVARAVAAKLVDNAAGDETWYRVLVLLDRMGLLAPRTTPGTVVQPPAVVAGPVTTTESPQTTTGSPAWAP